METPEEEVGTLARGGDAGGGEVLSGSRPVNGEKPVSEAPPQGPGAGWQLRPQRGWVVEGAQPAAGSAA